jgi:hypothetical protein
MSRKIYDADRRAIAKYQKTKCRAYTIRFVYSMDSDIIDFIEKQPKRADFFREVFRQYMKNTENNKPE